MRVVHCAYDGSAPTPSERPPLRLSIHGENSPTQVLPKGAETASFLSVGTGHATVRIGTASPTLLRPDTSLIVRPSSSFVYRGPSPLLVLSIAPDAVTTVKSQLPDGPLPPTAPAHSLHRQVDNPPALQQCLRSLWTLATTPSPYQPALIDLTATQLLVLLLQSPARPFLESPRPSHPPGLTDAVRYARRHLHRPLSMDELARRACMSRSTFYRHFRATFGVTPLQYVTRLRIEHARALLHDPTRSVTDVSLDLGFSSVSHFIETFKQHTGTTPKAYQQSHQP